ncbi:sulfotransferase [Ancylobacter sp. MQZ15Z-1]|uniref:Sulfotransferase n=1 Tax=Ancylobacter mangrovi TaxID=2972472 RepID=A0A9X2P9Z7_9HYPH|nr:sulfotransferase [Ancylobacter mangrovi]MCS0494080.1 sulfotransferase [Ancylobacter mangrovi]
MPQPLFILCPPRSYSSIVCAMLGQHPQCYGLPELNLFLGDTLGEIWYGTVFMRSFGKHGLLRTLAELHDGEQTEDSVIRAQSWIETRLNWPIAKVFAHIQECVGERILIDKSPSTLFRQEALARVMLNFPDASLLHLTRHPRGTSESVIALREGHEGLKSLNQVLNDSDRSDPERMWRLSHELVLAMTTGLPLGRYMRLKGEWLMANLAVYLPQICDWLDIRSDADAIQAMMHPETSPYACPGPANAPRGNDPNFLENPRLDPERLARLKEPRLEGELSWNPGAHFDPRTVGLAKRLGYA